MVTRSPALGRRWEVGKLLGVSINNVLACMVRSELTLYK